MLSYPVESTILLNLQNIPINAEYRMHIIGIMHENKTNSDNATNILIN